MQEGVTSSYDYHCRVKCVIRSTQRLFPAPNSRNRVQLLNRFASDKKSENKTDKDKQHRFVEDPYRSPAKCAYLALR